MNSIQRFYAVLNQQSIDQIPVMVSNYNLFLTFYYDISILEYLNNPDKNAECFIRLVNEFKFDVIYPARGYIFYGCGSETGLEWVFTEENFPACVKGIINSPDDIQKIKIPNEPKGYFKKFLEIYHKVQMALGGKTLLVIDVLGPFSVMAFFRGFENLLIDMIENPDFFKKMMEKSVEFSFFLARECLRLEIPRIELNEVFIIPEAISPEHYHYLISPYIEKVRKLSTPPLIHLESSFIGKPSDRRSQKEGRKYYHYHWGTLESIDAIRKAPKSSIPDFPHLISLSGDALANWSLGKIIDFLSRGLEYFLIELGILPCIHLASIQASNRKHANEIANKLKGINDLCKNYPLMYDKIHFFHN
jgi:uroporphyrinogen-III decarboxylase